MSMRKSVMHPQPPDMPSDSVPNLTTFRASRARQLTVTEERTAEPPRRRYMPRLSWKFVIIGGALVLSAFICWTALIVPWWSGVQDQWNYGNARITQMDANTDSAASPIILISTVKDANTGRMDLLVQVKDTDFETVLYNTGSGFSTEEE